MRFALWFSGFAVLFALVGSSPSPQTLLLRSASAQQPPDGRVPDARTYVYVAEAYPNGRQNLPDGCIQLRKSDGWQAEDQLALGDRLEVLGEEGDRFRVRLWDGREGPVEKSTVQRMDPKTYFSTTINGKSVVGFLLGLAHCSFLNVLEVLTESSRVERIPIPEIAEVDVGPTALAILTTKGSVITAKAGKWNEADEEYPNLPALVGGPVGFYIYGELALVRRGSRALTTKDFKRPEIVLKPRAVLGRLVLKRIDVR